VVRGRAVWWRFEAARVPILCQLAAVSSANSEFLLAGKVDHDIVPSATRYPPQLSTGRAFEG
jgi:hypothetical protein